MTGSWGDSGPALALPGADLGHISSARPKFLRDLNPKFIGDFKKTNQASKQKPNQKPSGTHSYADVPNQCCFYVNDFRY